ncbi:hypothetical protein B4135_0124 [Caldibacillus debilis]|uniref:Uncharacterized protein n=1 Tax=Caldibacillus debilis TaxID=301148 RepID=A0A150M4D9_9BACI|nr:hypothetical protein B4135_0124 [Caldibacillus debilis]
MFDRRKNPQGFLMEKLNFIPQNRGRFPARRKRGCTAARPAL